MQIKKKAFAAAMAVIAALSGSAIAGVTSSNDSPSDQPEQVVPRHLVKGLLGSGIDATVHVAEGKFVLCSAVQSDICLTAGSERWADNFGLAIGKPELSKLGVERQALDIAVRKNHSLKDVDASVKALTLDLTQTAIALKSILSKDSAAVTIQKVSLVTPDLLDQLVRTKELYKSLRATGSCKPEVEDCTAPPQNMDPIVVVGVDNSPEYMFRGRLSEAVDWLERIINDFFGRERADPMCVKDKERAKTACRRERELKIQVCELRNRTNPNAGLLSECIRNANSACDECVDKVEERTCMA